MIDLRAARARLDELEERLLCRLGQHPDEAAAHADVYDQARASYERETSAFDADRIRARVADVHAALQRLAAGVYGICERCGEDIGKKRLEAIPETPACVACAEVLERVARAATARPSRPIAADEGDC